MEDITEVSFENCTNSKFVQLYRVKYKQNGQLKFWDCTRLHNSVAILIFNKTRKRFVLVKQFRPAVYVSRQQHLLKDIEVFSTSLSMKGLSEDRSIASSGIAALGPGSLGTTYEMCAGIVDKGISLVHIAREEVLEETGYHVPVESLEIITSFFSSVGHGGSQQTMYYCEVTDAMLQSKGGGNQAEGEFIDVLHVPLEEAETIALDASIPRSTGLCFAMMWFIHYKNHLYS